jgi:hypothetical protein
MTSGFRHRLALWRDNEESRSYVLFHRYALLGRRLPLWIKLDKLGCLGGVAQW